MGGKKFEKRGMIAFAGEEQTFSEEGKKIRDRFASKEFFFGRNKWREGGEVVWKKIRDLFESKLRVSNRCCDLKCMYFARDNRGRMIIRKGEIWREKKRKNRFRDVCLN